MLSVVFVESVGAVLAVGFELCVLIFEHAEDLAKKHGLSATRLYSAASMLPGANRSFGGA